jgi:hypothetical protein
MRTWIHVPSQRIPGVKLTQRLLLLLAHRCWLPNGDEWRRRERSNE